MAPSAYSDTPREGKRPIFGNKGNDKIDYVDLTMFLGCIENHLRKGQVAVFNNCDDEEEDEEDSVVDDVDDDDDDDDDDGDDDDAGDDDDE